MPYFAHQLVLSEDQIKRLAHGQKIKITFDQTASHPETLLLTKRQITKLTKAQSEHKGTTLQFSNTQAIHNAQHGSGLFSDVFNKIKGVARQAYQAIVPAAKDALSQGSKWVAQNYGDKLVELASRGANSAFDQASQMAYELGRAGISELPQGELRSVADNMFQTGLNMGNSLAQSELRRFLEGVKRSQAGAGLFDFLGSDVGGFLNSVGNMGIDVIKKVGPDIAASLIKKQLGGAARGRPRGRGGRFVRGTGLYPPGTK